MEREQDYFLEDDERQWMAERDEMMADEFYWEWLVAVEKRLNEDLGLPEEQ